MFTLDLCWSPIASRDSNGQKPHFTASTLDTSSECQMLLESRLSYRAVSSGY